MNRASILIVLLFALISTSCVKPSNKNKIFAGFDPSSKQYKQELARQVTGKNARDMTFIFNQLVKIEGRDYLDISISAKDMQARGFVLVNNWAKLEGLKRTWGKGYGGAELRNLKLEIDNSTTGPTLIYKDLEKIVD
ncbi:hypothetical protein [Mucilaginibacter sp.]|jgi:hypothetical protein|uniref:hypothetical protein n=1 Tax=Mucilaginibacter sp. TaxID=1882438 RepID=UPI00356258FA